MRNCRRMNRRGSCQGRGQGRRACKMDGNSTQGRGRRFQNRNQA